MATKNLVITVEKGQETHPLKTVTEILPLIREYFETVDDSNDDFFGGKVTKAKNTFKVTVKIAVYEE